MLYAGWHHRERELRIERVRISAGHYVCSQRPHPRMLLPGARMATAALSNSIKEAGKARPEMDHIILNYSSVVVGGQSAGPHTTGSNEGSSHEHQFLDQESISCQYDRMSIIIRWCDLFAIYQASALP